MTEANLTDTLVRAHYELTEADWRASTVAERKFMRTEVRPLVNAMREFLAPIDDPELRSEAKRLVAQMYAETDAQTSTTEVAITESVEYRAIASHYEGRVAERSGIPYIQHINEGLWVMHQYGATPTAALAYCLHPLAQGDEDLARFDTSLASTPEVLMAVIEYRNVANRYLSFHQPDPARKARVSPLRDVNFMLVADKIQNRKDFEDHHAATHEHSERLATYFTEWLEALYVPEKNYQRLAAGLRALPDSFSPSIVVPGPVAVGRPDAADVAERIINLLTPRIYGSKRDAKAAYRDAKLDESASARKALS